MDTIVLASAIVYSSNAKTIFAGSTIDKNEIASLPGPTIEPLLNATPGLWMQTGALNTNRISIRGVGYREPFATTGIKVYLDEIPLTNGVGEASIEDIHPYILSGIDIWRGPSSAIWGSGLGGMIQLKTDMPVEDMIKTTTQVGSFGRIQLDQDIAATYGTSDQWGTALHYQFLQDDGYRANNDYRKHSWTWMQQWHNQKGLTLKSFLHGIELKAFIPSSLHLGDFQNNPSSAAPTWNAVHANEDYTKWISGLNIQYISPNGWLYRGAVFANTFNSDEVRPFNILNEGNTSYGTRHRMTFSLNKSTFLTTGIELFREKYQFTTFETLSGGIAGEKLTSQKEFRSYFNGFIQSEFHFGTLWNLFAGLHASFSELHNNDYGVDIPASIYPTAGISYLFSKYFSIAASVSRGYSALGLDDVLSSSGTINHDILPESGWNKEISFMVGDLNRSYAKLNFFHMNIDNTVITKRIDEDQFEKLNGGSSLHRGIEVEYSVENKRTTLQWKGSCTIGSHVFKDFIDAGNDYSDNVLPGTPAYRTYNYLKWMPLHALSIHAEHHWISDVYLSDDNMIKGEGYQLINAGFKLRIASRKRLLWELTGNVHNIAGIDYSPMFQINALGAQPRYYYPGKPRSFYTGISIRYSFVETN